MSAQEGIRFRFSPHSSKSRKVLGPLEGDIMEVVWQQNPATVGTVHQALSQKKDIAYTTVMTTMTRLARKHLLEQDRSRSTYRYSPAMNRVEFERYVVTGVLRGLLEDYGEQVIEVIVDEVAELGPEVEAQLRSRLCR